MWYVVKVEYWRRVEVDAVSTAAAELAAAATGQTVVYKNTVSVVTWPILAGQSVTLAAQLIIVYVVVPYTVEVVYAGADVTTPAEVCSDVATGEVGEVTAPADVSVAETGQIVGDKALVSVVPCPIWAGPSVTGAAPLVLV